jgi:tryptophan synthase alpha chain
MIGFGISRPEQAAAAAALADGVIVGSALVRLTREQGVEAACLLAGKMREAIDRPV